MHEGWRRNLYVIWLATFASLVGGNLALPFLPLFIQQDLGVSDPGTAAVWAGLASAMGGVAMAVMAPIWGSIADRHGRKAMLVRAQFAMGAANATQAFVGAPWQLVGVRAVQGMFSGVVGASRALVASTVPRERVPYAMGLIQSAVFLGQTLGPTIGGIVGSLLGFRATFMLTGGVNSLAGILALLYVREVKTSAPRKSSSFRAGIAEVMKSRSLAILIGIQLVATIANMGVRPVLPLFLAEIEPGHDVVLTAGLGFAVLGLAGAVASVGVSRAAARIGLQRLVAAAAVGAAIFNVLVATATSPMLALLILFGVGLFQGAVACCVAALVSLYAPSHRQATAFGVASSAHAIAMGTGPLLGGILASAIDLRAPFVAGGLFLLGAAALSLALGPILAGNPAAAE
ncbi:MAG: MFS transporter [Chloroflexota bacterium]|nr:MFS transporter [Chloroflexota bacterium]